MRKKVFDVIAGYSVNEGMDDAVLQNKEYISIQDKIQKQTELLNQLNLSERQYKMVFRLINSHIESGAFYGAMTYKQGFLDCVELLREVNLLKVS
ncbi:MAG: hypothetical protein NC231_07260 [Bacillus sp. (in: Bacteria)]|nr:hypothetical protein [Bacillus sp. (in: firmicutes)]MCM1426460.1 hypothetical protein [Eubacterium sp.]